MNLFTPISIREPVDQVSQTPYRIYTYNTLKSVALFSRSYREEMLLHFSQLAVNLKISEGLVFTSLSCGLKVGL
jgi:hypothetical protein